MCEYKNLTSCLICEKGLYVFQGECLPACPKGFKTNSDNSACVILNLQDLGVIYFPFLTMAAIITLVCVCGMFK